MPDFDDVMVSCLMVTLPVPRRLPYLRRSIASYCQQTHRRKELVIVLDAGAADAKSAIAAHVASLGRDDIRIVDPSAKLSLGALRNLSWASAGGSVVCHWDDDDLYHPRRLEMQLQALDASGSQGLCLQEVLLYFSGARTLYCINWRATPVKGLPGSLMCRRSAPIRYPEVFEPEPSEDTAVVLQLQELHGFSVLEDCAHLYVYVCHGENSWSGTHFRMLADRLGISRGLLLRREARLREGLGPYDFGRGAVTVQGSNGPAFVLGEGPQEHPGDSPRA